MRSKNKKGKRRRDDSKRLKNKADGNKGRHSKIPSELESVTQIDMQSFVSGATGNQRGLSAAGPAQERQ
jgi:hypothetical protein